MNIPSPETQTHTRTERERGGIHLLKTKDGKLLQLRSRERDKHVMVKTMTNSQHKHEEEVGTVMKTMSQQSAIRKHTNEQNDDITKKVKQKSYKTKKVEGQKKALKIKCNLR